MPTIVLHQWCISPLCTKVRKILAFKGLPYRIEDYAGFRALKARSLSASGKLPVLDYDGTRLEDSSAIARFLDERHPEPPLFPAALDRSLIHLLEDWADESLYWFELWSRLYDKATLDRAVEVACEGLPSYEHTFYKMGMTLSRKSCAAQGIARYPRETVLNNFQAHLTALEERLERNPWLAGAEPSLADIAVAAQLDEVVRTSPLAREIHARPALAAWLSRCDFSPNGNGARGFNPVTTLHDAFSKI